MFKPFPPAHIREIVQTAIRNHPPACQFVPNVVDRIMDSAPPLYGADEAIEWIVAAIKAHEIYCPHEGIDRRAEFCPAPDCSGEVNKCKHPSDCWMTN